MGQEKNFENRIKRHIREIGGWFVKFYGCAYSKAGIPDLIVCVNGRFVAIEVKADYGSPSELQLYNVKKIREAGGLAWVLYPSGWNRMRKIFDEIIETGTYQASENESLVMK